jgi:hypothetical protein
MADIKVIPAPAPPGPTRGVIATVILTIVGWLTQPGEVPWAKFAVLTVVGMISLVGAIAWDQRTVFVTVWARNDDRGAEVLSGARATVLLPALMRRTGAVAAAVWDYDLPSNAQTLVLAQDERGKKLLEGVEILPIFRSPHAPSTAVVAGLIVGNVPCGAITEQDAPDIVAVRTASGATLYCVAAVNSVFGQLRGTVLAFFTKEPDREAIAIALRAAAIELARPKEH